MRKKKDLGDLITDNKENAEVLSTANKKVASDKDKIEKKISKLILENKQNAEEISTAYKIIVTQKKVIKKRTADLIRANKEKEKHKAEFVIAKKELVLAKEKAKLVAELTLVNKELTIQITERKQSEKALFESEERFRLLFNQAPLGYQSLDFDGNFIDVNQQWLDTLGYTREEVIGKWFGDFLSPAYQDGFRQRFPIFLAQGKIHNEYEMVHKNGIKLFIAFEGRIGYDTKGEFKQTHCILQDITERKKAEKTLQDIIDYNPMAIQILDAEGFTIKVNQAFMLLYGSKPPSDYSMFNDIQLNEKGFGKLIYKIKNGEVVHFPDMPFNAHDSVPEMPDVPAWIRTIVFPLLDINGKPEKFVFIHENITESKQAESELIKAKEKAEESDRLKSAFLANMSHEIRTPMNGILGFAELLKEPNLSSDDEQDFIQTIQISGARMLNTINNIVDVSKIESGLMKVNIQETNINEKIEFTYKFFKPEVELKGLQFLYKNGLPTKDAVIKTDSEKVSGILTNLIKNAIKFTYKGSIEFGYEKKGAFLEFYVKDTGVGIPKNQQQTIFERFTQGSYDFNRLYEGSGLGLSICKSYVEMLGGKIWVESEEVRGSILYFTIPYNSVSEEKHIIGNVVSTEEEEVQLKKLKILIVEDDETSYSLMRRMLLKISTEVFHAITGVEAIEACRRNPDLDLVLMDIRMPIMDGNEATRQIRQFNKDVIIIAQTAYAFSGDSEKAIEAGCNDYISKPINKTLLYTLIKKLVNKDKK